MIFLRDFSVRYNKEFLIELNSILKEILIWEADFQKKIKNYDFDIDDKLYFLSEKYNVSFDNVELKLIYNLVDFYCDAVKHEFDRIDEGYSLNQAKEDIIHVMNAIESSEFQTIILMQELFNRLNKVFG